MWNVVVCSLRKIHELGNVCEQLNLRSGEVLDSGYYILRKCAAKLEILTKETLKIQAF